MLLQIGPGAVGAFLQTLSAVIFVYVDFLSIKSVTRKYWGFFVWSSRTATRKSLFRYQVCYRRFFLLGVKNQPAPCFPRVLLARFSGRTKCRGAIIFPAVINDISGHVPGTATGTLMGDVEKTFLHQLVNSVPELPAAYPFTIRLGIGIDDFTIVFDEPLIRSFTALHRLHLPLTEKIQIHDK